MGRCVCAPTYTDNSFGIPCYIREIDTRTHTHTHIHLHLIACLIPILQIVPFASILRCCNFTVSHYEDLHFLASHAFVSEFSLQDLQLSFLHIHPT